MRRILTVAAGLLAATSVFSSNSFTREHPAQMIATTARIIRIIAKNRTLVVSGSEGAAIHHMVAQKETLWPRIAVQLPGITFPRGITFPLPGGNARAPQPTSTPNIEHLDEYTILTTSDTLFQDGSDSIQFEDFKTGETISIHGELKGTILTASRLAKWN
jgi:hypothetical protein